MMLTKAIEKRKTRRSHTRNFTAGEVAASEHYLERTGIRGKKRWVVLLAIVILAVIIVGNFIVSCVCVCVCVCVRACVRVCVHYYIIASTLLHNCFYSSRA